MENKETNQMNNLIKELPKKYLKHREIVWKSMGSKKPDLITQKEELTKHLQKEFNFALDKYEKNIPPTEEDYLFAKFVYIFGSEFINKDRFNSIKEKLVKNQNKYPVLRKIDQIIKTFRENALNFSVSSGKDYDKTSKTLNLSRTNNKLADIIITTEIKRVIVDEKTRVLPNGGTLNSSTSLNVLDDKFEIIFKK